jgi:glycosyltransferase involved in cell wall biosynthesis
MIKMFLPEVSVVVPIYNGEADLPDLIECLRSQTYPPDSVEYLLVDNTTVAIALQASSKQQPLTPPQSPPW